MARTKDELAADLVWRYVEHLRAASEGAASLALTREELLDLADLLETAGGVPAALEGSGTQESAEAARARVQGLLASAPPRSRSELGGWAARARGFFTAGTVSGRRFGASLAVSALLVSGLATVNLWHRPQPPPVVRVMVDQPADVQRMDERQAHDLIPRMVQNELTAREERNLMWHMLVCPGCFDQYVELKHPGDGSRQALQGPYLLTQR